MGREFDRQAQLDAAVGAIAGDMREVLGWLQWILGGLVLLTGIYLVEALWDHRWFSSAIHAFGCVFLTNAWRDASKRASKYGRWKR